MHDLYMYDWVTLLYSRNWHNIVNQLCLNKKIILKKKKNLDHVVSIATSIPCPDSRTQDFPASDNQNDLGGVQMARHFKLLHIYFMGSQKNPFTQKPSSSVL